MQSQGEVCLLRRTLTVTVPRTSGESSGMNPCTEPGREKWNRAPFFGSDRRLPAEAAPHIDQGIRLANGIRDAAPAVGGRQEQAVGHRAAPVGAGIDARQAVFDPQQAADIAGIAVGVPPGRVGDHQRPLESHRPHAAAPAG